MIAEKNDVEIVSIAGDKKVGYWQTVKIAEQLDNILSSLKPQEPFWSQMEQKTNQYSR